MKPETLKAYLKKIPFILLIYMVGGAYCRWYQLQNELLYDGSLTEGAFMHRVLLILSVTLFVGLGLLLSGLKKISTHKAAFSRHIFPVLLQILAGILLSAGCALELLIPRETTGVYTTVSMALIKYQPYLGILGGLLIVAFAFLTYMDKTPSPLLYMLTSIFLVVRLIVFFQSWNMDPSAHDYAYKLLAAITTMLGCYHMGGFCFGKGKRSITVFWCLCAAFFCAISLADYWGSLPNLLVDGALLILTLTQGLQLLFATEPPENTPAEDSLPEETPVEEA